MISKCLVPLLFSFFFAASIANAEVPARPEFGILDQASLLPLPILKATERLLSQHEGLTDEQISLFTITGAAKGSLPQIANAVFEEWRQVAPHPPDAILILVNGDRGEIEIRAGLGLDPVLTKAKIAIIRNQFFRPEWAAGKKSRAVILTLVEVLRGLGSPLISSGEATEIYERAGFSGGWTPAIYEEKSWVAWLAAILGLAVAVFALIRIQIGEVHYTATGWFPIPASRNLKRLFRRRGQGPALVTGGGVSGEY